MPKEAIENLPAAGSGESSEVDYRGDVLWLLNRLAGGETVHIRCGGPEYEEPGGKLWGKDRFARGGRDSKVYGGDIQGTEADPLYQTERNFPHDEAGEHSAYAIPLPPGKYRVHLHFAEGFMNIQGFRRFDVLLEGKKVLEDFQPMEAGFATALEKIFDVAVNDGMLEIHFVHRPPRDPPKVSAIEIERIE